MFERHSRLETTVEELWNEEVLHAGLENWAEQLECKEELPPVLWPFYELSIEK